MQTAIALFLILFRLIAIGGQMEERVTIEKVESQYSISYFNYKSDTLEYFERLGLQGGGYTWKSLVKSALQAESPELLSQIESDAEGDAFVAYSANQSSAQAVKDILNRLSSDLDYRQKYIKAATDAGHIE